LIQGDWENAVANASIDPQKNNELVLDQHIIKLIKDKPADAAAKKKVPKNKQD
jgi:hypothetical protein